MTYQAFLIKYSEIGVKGKNRFMFEDALVRQIKRALDNNDKLYVGIVKAPAAWVGMPEEVSKWIKDHVEEN